MGQADDLQCVQQREIIKNKYEKEGIIMMLNGWNYERENEVRKYRVCEETIGNPTYATKGAQGISKLGAVVATVAGLIFALIIVALLDRAEDTSMVLTVILWSVCSAGFGTWFDDIGL